MKKLILFCALAVCLVAAGQVFAGDCALKNVVGHQIVNDTNLICQCKKVGQFRECDDPVGCVQNEQNPTPITVYPDQKFGGTSGPTFPICGVTLTSGQPEAVYVAVRESNFYIWTSEFGGSYSFAGSKETDSPLYLVRQPYQDGSTSILISSTKPQMQ